MKVKKFITPLFLLVVIVLTASLSSCQVYYAGKFQYDFDVDTKMGYRIELRTNLNYVYIHDGVQYSGRYTVTPFTAQLKITENNDVNADVIKVIEVKMISRNKISFVNDDGETITLMRAARNILDPLDVPEPF
ncbi:MAG: hypothetical protein LBQ40_07320 [Clostridiales bacterium]|jgi:hypothetical protein|nr:hypothetical protein [Clostridiales bacterium]